MNNNSDLIHTSEVILDSWCAEASFDELIKIFLPVLSNNQTNNDWDKDQACTFIESILLGIPISSIYIAILNEKRYIIDGYQRIKTVFDYINGVHSNDNTEFNLSCSNNNELTNKSYKTLDGYLKLRLKTATITITIVRLKEEKKLLELAKRINPQKGLRMKYYV